VAPVVLQAIIRTESGYDPLALHLNGNVRLRSPPKTAAQAAIWSDWLIRQGYSVDMGLMQINSRNLTTLNLTTADAFDPCRNIRAGAAILTAQYGRAADVSGEGTKALLQAISAYNTGTFHRGFKNGYVAKIVVNAQGTRSGAPPGQMLDLTCLLAGCSPRQASTADPSMADSAIGGFGAP
jgi:type IV secretion system protein VirB1